ncbi:MAG: NADH-quinone oxidoreductase subunit K [Planctomycetota bacterium]
MNPWGEIILVFLILANLRLLGSSRLVGSIRVVAAQGAALGLLPLLSGGSGPIALRAAVIAAGTILLKGVIFPRLLLRTMRGVGVRHEMEPFVGYTSSLLAGFAGLAISFWIASRMPLAGRQIPALVVSTALFTILTGLFLIAARRTALNQVLGFLVLENGIYVFGLSAVEEVPLLVELGVLLDLFVAVFVMGIAIYHISREFEHVDVDELDRLKG